MDVNRDIILIHFDEESSREKYVEIDSNLTVSVLFDAMREVYGATEKFFDILCEGEEAVVWPKVMPKYLIVVPNCDYTFYVRAGTARHLANLPINIPFCFKIGTYRERLSAIKIAEIVILSNNEYEQTDIEDYAIRIAREKKIDIGTNDGKRRVKSIIEEQLKKL